MKIYMVATEPSGDALAADVIDKLRETDRAVEIVGVGGKLMAQRGISSAIDISELAVMGLVEGLKIYKTVKEKVEETAANIIQQKPDCVVLIDSWGFMWRVAKRVRELGYKGPRIKLIGPQVWATRPGRAKVLADHVDHLLCIHKFEQPFYEPYGLDTTVIGNPALDRLEIGNAEVFRKKFDISADKRIVLLLLGSRKSEIRNVAPTLEAAAAAISKSADNVVIVCVAAGAVAEEVTVRSRSWNFPYLLSTDEDDKSDAFRAGTLALACSGTVTTEIAMQGVPLVVGYKIGWITWAIARLFLMKSKFITLMNVAVDKEIIPEFVQTRFVPRRVLYAARRLLEDASARESQVQAQYNALDKMGRGGLSAAEIAAEKILELSKASNTKH